MCVCKFACKLKLTFQNFSNACWKAFFSAVDNQMPWLTWLISDYPEDRVCLSSTIEFCSCYLLLLLLLLPPIQCQNGVTHYKSFVAFFTSQRCDDLYKHPHNIVYLWRCINLLAKRRDTFGNQSTQPNDRSEIKLIQLMILNRDDFAMSNTRHTNLKNDLTIAQNTRSQFNRMKQTLWSTITTRLTSTTLMCSWEYKWQYEIQQTTAL